MGEARNVLYRRKCELQRDIRKLKEREEEYLKELKSVRDAIIHRERLLQEVVDVHSTLPL